MSSTLNVKTIVRNKDGKLLIRRLIGKSYTNQIINGFKDNHKQVKLYNPKTGVRKTVKMAVFMIGEKNVLVSVGTPSLDAIQQADFVNIYKDESFLNQPSVTEEEEEEGKVSVDQEHNEYGPVYAAMYVPYNTSGPVKKLSDDSDKTVYECSGKLKILTKYENKGQYLNVYFHDSEIEKVVGNIIQKYISKVYGHAAYPLDYEVTRIYRDMAKYKVGIDFSEKI